MGGIAGSLALHGAIVAAMVALVVPGGAPHEEAAITIFVDPASPPVARASEFSRAPVPAPQAEELSTEQAQEEQPPEAEPQREEPPLEAIVAALPTTPEPDLREAVPQPPAYESLAAPDFKPPPRQTPPRAQPPKAAPTRTPVPAAPARSAAPAEVATPVPAQRPTGAPSAPAVAVAPGWNALLAAWLAAHRRYPDESRRRHEEGEVSVRFTVAGDGRVLDVAVVQSSGFAVLDAAALAMLRGAALPPPGIEATRVVRVRYRLAD